MKSKYVNNTAQKLTKKGWSLARTVKANSILVTCIASIGINAITNVECSFNQQINSITPNENFSTEFIYYLMNNSKENLLKYAGAGALPMLNKNTFSSIKFKFPTLSEQTAIAAILATADRELQLQKDKLAHLQLQKKGLMQVLLTGKKRLIN
jgi:type I restriction enzyme S subunit